MTAEEFIDSTTEENLPEGLSKEQEALWFIKNNRWEKAHDIAQDIHTELGSWLHAHLHLIEGDIGNAGYWYSRANRKPIGKEGLENE